MKLPPFLSPGSLIAITCPSGFLEASHAKIAEETLKSWGFEVEIGKTVGHGYHYFSGDDEMRLAELQSLLDNPNVAAIMAGRGGYGLSRIIDRIDFTQFKSYPKWLIGFSDITVLHAEIHTQCGIASIHGPMCHAFMEAPDGAAWLETLRSMLVGTPIHYALEGDINNKEGQAEGILTGGNLSLLAHLCGSRSQPDTQNKILFIEDVNEYIYAIDRMLITLKRAGMLENLSGLVCGGFTELKDTDRPFGSTLQEIVLEKVNEHNFPVCFGFSAGHLEKNFPVMLGKKHRIVVTKSMATLSQA